MGEDVEPEKLEELDVDQWLTGPWAGQQHADNLSKLKLYAYACKQQLGEKIRAGPRSRCSGIMETVAVFTWTQIIGIKAQSDLKLMVKKFSFFF